jgi:hypothetical protein
MSADSQIHFYGEIKKFDLESDGSMLVSGIASTEAVDSQGEIITADAMRKALPAYLQKGTVREMHEPLAAGVPVAAHVDDDGKTHFTARIVDAGTIAKIKAGVLKGFSIGGKALAKIGNKITEILLKDISVVDIPCNPESYFSIIKFDRQVEKCSDSSCKNFDESAVEKCGMCKSKVQKRDGGFLVNHDGETHLPTRKNGKLDHNLMGAAWAALHSGYPGGNKYEGPQKQEAIAKLKRLYKEEGMETPDENDTEKFMNAELLQKVDSLAETVATLAASVEKLSKPAATIPDLKKFEDALGDLQKRADEAAAKVIEGERGAIIQKMKNEARVIIGEDGLGMKEDDLKKMDLPTLKVLARNAQSLPTVAKTTYTSTGTPPEVDEFTKVDLVTGEKVPLKGIDLLAAVNAKTNGATLAEATARQYKR